jgi:CMP-N-acetylneuraminic acid synthetase/UDP-N-acetylglucosamine:LPS N-acetylglucosamine transferase
MICNKKVIAIVPVRGGSKGIPRKNSRLLAGKPLLSYSISACLKSKYIDRVFVSTEDPSLKEIALKFGANIINRDERLSADEVPLDDVIVDAVKKVETEFSYHPDLVASIQATSPLISHLSLDQAIKKCINGKYDTVVSAVDDSHLRWGHNPKGSITPLYHERLNRQYLPKVYKETGGFVIAKRSTLNSNTRFGNSICLQKLSKEESVDIDDRYDWWLVEKSLARKKICFHVIGNSKKGLGHVYRALSLADRIMDHDIFFVVNDENQLAIHKIESQFYKLKVCKKGEEVETILEGSPDLVINDVLNTKISFMKKLKLHGIRLINFEDLGKGSICADVVINALFNDHPYINNGQLFSGIEYCCLRDEFFYTQPKEYSEEVKKIIILFGGTDPENLSDRILRWLEELKGKWKIDLILGLGYPEKRENDLISFVENSSKDIEIIKDTNVISKFMQEADIAITAAGRTLFELTALAVPMIVIASNKRELLHDILDNSFGLISLGVSKNLNKEIFQSTALELLNSNILRKNMRKALLKQNVRGGIENVLEIIKNILKIGNGSL